MILADLFGAAMTLAFVLFAGLAGVLGAAWLLGERAHRDALAFAVTALLLGISLPILIALLLGALGQLALGPAFALLALAVVGLLARVRHEKSPWAPLVSLGARLGDRLREHAALSILAAHAAGSELLRGLFRPPLSWDSLMYHLLLAGHWFHSHDLSPVFGAPPQSFYGLQPGDGSLWLWWWMAPSHSELYVNLAFAPQWLLLGLAAGGVARELGARRHWPIAMFSALLTPTILRFVAAQYVDLQVGAGLVAAFFLALLWLDEPRGSSAVLSGLGLGLAAGTKVLAAPFAALGALSIALFGLARGSAKKRLAQIAAAALTAALLGGYFYARNVALGVGPFGLGCEVRTEGPSAEKVVPRLPRQNSVLDRFGDFWASGELVDAALGVTRPPSLELGVGPSFVLLLPVLFLPWLVRRDRRAAAWLIWSQLVIQVGFWLTIPGADSGTIFANVRYLDGAIALAFAGLVAWLEAKNLSGAWFTGIALALAAQNLLMLHAEMPRGVRLLAAAGLAVALGLALSPTLRTAMRARAREVAVVVAALSVLAAPFWANFRVRDRGRAMAQDLSVHSTPIARFARAWSALDQNAQDGTVALAMSPLHYFVYPAMGPRLERKVIYVAPRRNAPRTVAAYPACDARQDPDPAAWVENIESENVRWLLVQRMDERLVYPPEKAWAEARPDLFALAYEDANSVIFAVRAEGGDRQSPLPPN